MSPQTALETLTRELGAGQKLPNWWGLHDLHGNVWEWCSDWYGPYTLPDDAKPDDVVVDPKGPPNGHQHAWRGGSFADSALNARSTSRGSFGRPDYRPDFATGFRVVREFPAP